jgi:hypothetical protein
MKELVQYFVPTPSISEHQQHSENRHTLDNEHPMFLAIDDRLIDRVVIKPFFRDFTPFHAAILRSVVSG